MFVLPSHIFLPFFLQECSSVYTEHTKYINFTKYIALNLLILFWGICV